MRYEQHYGYYALDTLYRAGSRELEFRCFGCPYRRRVKIEHLIGKYGPGIELFDLGRRATCSKCGRESCFVEVATPPAPGEPGYKEWAERAVRQYEEFLALAKRYR